jgi:hypothetical protein
MRTRYVLVVGLMAGLAAASAGGCSKGGNAVEAPAKYTERPKNPPVGLGGEGTKPMKGKDATRSGASGAAE